MCKAHTSPSIMKAHFHYCINYKTNNSFNIQNMKTKHLTHCLPTTTKAVNYQSELQDDSKCTCTFK